MFDKFDIDLNDLARKAREGDATARADLQSHLRPHLNRLLRRADQGGGGVLGDKLRQAALRVREAQVSSSPTGTATRLARLLADRLSPHRTAHGIQETLAT